MTANTTINIEKHILFYKHEFVVTCLPSDLLHDASINFARLWELHPADFHEIPQPFTGKRIPVPRWQQAYGHDYRFAGTTNRALRIPDLLTPFLEWSRRQFDGRLNGLLLNWYDANRHHYIGPHSDSTKGLIPGTPTVTISLGATRVFRVHSRSTKERRDFDASHGAVFVMPWETNLHTKHEVLYRADSYGQRISVTARAFAT
jgi:alkylated DNA repair dioxygenase AlkB